MFAVLSTARKVWTLITMSAAAVALSACEPVATGGSGSPSVTSGEAVQVALLLPSGSAGDDVLARSLKQAAELAIRDLNGAKINLRVYDAGAGAGSGAAAATKAVAEGAKVILGPVYAETANAAGLAVASKGVNVLSFSNNTDIAGGNVFVLGPTFQNTANRLVGYAASQGKRNILIVHENNPAGNLGARAIANAARKSSVQVGGTIGYDFSQQGVMQTVPSIVAQQRATGANAVFFTADTAGALPLLTQLLPEQGLSNSTAQFAGLTRWDLPSATLALPGVQGGWFALPDPGLTSQFNARYQQAYGQAPHPIAGLAYDGIAAIGALVRSGRKDALSRAALTQGSGFAGVNGVFRLLPDGSNERGLAVATIRNNQVVVIDAAPRSFGGTGL